MNKHNNLTSHRRQRLQAWIDQYAINRTELAKRLERSRSYVSLLLIERKETDMTKPRHFGEKAARSIEAKLGMYAGYLDNVGNTKQSFLEQPYTTNTAKTTSPKSYSPTCDVPTGSLPYRIEDVGPMYSIIVGAPASGQISRESYQQAIDLFATVFESFTVIKSDGCFKGKLEDSLLFQVATQEPLKVIQLAAQLAKVFDQEGVGIVRPANFEGVSTVYSRVIPNRLSTPI